MSPTIPNTGLLNLRTLFDIIWSCASTLFICTWVSIHPNIPPPNESHIRSLWKRLKLMFWMYFAPELILAWAVRQWIAARFIERLFRGRGWTKTHGHFLIMGGFTLVGPDGSHPLTLDEFLDLLRSSKISFPEITDAEIRDKARGDFLSKVIAILQTTWFIVQCAARAAQGLAITELELVTLALASLNGIMYFFWWNKPLGVNQPVKIYLKGGEPAEKEVDEEQRELEKLLDRSELRERLDTLRPRVSRLKGLTSSIPRSFNNSSTKSTSFRSKLSSTLQQLSWASTKTYFEDQRKNVDKRFPFLDHLWIIYVLIYIPYKFFIQGLYNILTAIVSTAEFDSSTATHVPTYYAPKVGFEMDILFAFVLPFIATLFGGLHCFGWSFSFPTPIEKWFWRVGSLAMTVVPSALFLVIICVSIVSFVYAYVYDIDISEEMEVGMQPENMNIMVATSVEFVTIFGLIAYMLARTSLLVQAVVLLREQPESAFYVVDWTRFLPHV